MGIVDRRSDIFNLLSEDRIFSAIYLGAALLSLGLCVGIYHVGILVSTVISTHPLKQSECNGVGANGHLFIMNYLSVVYFASVIGKAILQCNCRELVSSATFMRGYT